MGHDDWCVSFTSGASNADANCRSRASRAGANNRSSGMAGANASDAWKDGSTRNSGAADANTSDANGGDNTRSGGAAGASTHNATILW